MDHHVPVAITEGLRRRGVDVLTAEEDGSKRLEDSELLERARTLGRVVFTQDDDFLILAAAWQAEGRRFSGVVYAHQLWLTIGACVEELHILAEAGLPADLENRVQFLPI